MQLDNNITHTKERIKQFHKMKLSVPVMPTPVTVKTVENIAAQLSGMPRSPSEFEIEPAYKRLLMALENRKLDSVNPRDLKIAPYALWYGNEKLGGNTDFLNFYLGWLKENPLPSNWRRLIYVYLKDFSYSSSFANSYAILSKAIRSALSHPDLKSRLEQWKNRHEKYGIFAENFDLKKSCKAFIVDANLDWQAFSSITGLEGELSTTGYAEAIGVEILNQLNSFSKGDAVKAAQQYHLADKRLRFIDKRVQVIEALLSPWVNGGTSVGDDIRKSVQDCLLLLFHDPRLPVNERSGWRDVKSDYKKVMFRWLVGESLDQFFAIIDQLAHEEHWKYRKAFWKAYYKSGALDEAWVVLGPDAKYYAKKTFGNTLSAGELIDGYYEKTQSVLIVKIGDLILAEWSHKGKCRAWKIGDKNCPTINLPRYSGHTLKLPSMKIVSHYLDDGITHRLSERYTWQMSLADFIYEQTGIRIQQRDYRI